MSKIRILLIALVVSGICTIAVAQPAAPAFNSRPGAAYTLYLNFTGFQFNGTWANSGQTPGNMSAYDNATSSFTAAQQANIKNIWSRAAEAYSMFNINVTTVDPAVAIGGLASNNYVGRQLYYDQTARVMHSVIGNRGNSGFYSGAGGVSYVDVWENSYAGSGNTNGIKTNWAFVSSLGGPGAFHNIFTATTHEVGHAAGLSHQGDWGGSPNNSYSTNNGSTTLAPFMGVGYGASRNTWSVGTTSATNTQNDALRILQNGGMGGFYNDGIGRSIATATALQLNGNSINSMMNQGVIIPISETAPNPIGVDNYTKGYFSFNTIGGLNTITLNAGTQWITEGVSDPHRSLDGSLRILDSLGNEIAAAATSSLGESLSVNLAAGLYYIEVSSAGGKLGSLGPNGNWIQRRFFDMGSYFLTGSIQAVPEAGGLMVCLAIGAVVFIRRRRI
jgi:hypothetical protein